MHKLFYLILLIITSSCSNLYRINSVKYTDNFENRKVIELPEIESTNPVLANSDFNLYKGLTDVYYITPNYLAINRRTFQNHIDGYYIENKNFFLIALIFKNDLSLIAKAENELKARNIDFSKVEFYPQNYVYENILTGYTGGSFQVDSYWESNENGLGKLNLIIQIKGKKNINTFKNQLASNNGFLSEIKYPIKINNDSKLFFATSICKVKNLSTSNQLLN